MYSGSHGFTQQRVVICAYGFIQAKNVQIDQPKHALGATASSTCQPTSTCAVLLVSAEQALEDSEGRAQEVQLNAI
jgi:hypothetical protein